MDKIELNFLSDNKYTTDVTYVDHYKNPANKESLKKLTKKKMIDDKKITQIGLLSDFHTFEIIALNGDGKLCENCEIYINDNLGSIDFIPHGSQPKWKVKYNGHFSNEIVEDPILKDVILIITVSGDDKINIQKTDLPIPEEIY